MNERKSNGVLEATKSEKQVMAVVPVPLEMYSEMLEILQELSFRKVGKLMNRMASLRPVDMDFTVTQPPKR